MDEQTLRIHFTKDSTFSQRFNGMMEAFKKIRGCAIIGMKAEYYDGKVKDYQGQHTLEELQCVIITYK